MLGGVALVVHTDVRAELVAAVADRFRATTLGAGLDDPDLGPLVSLRQQERVRGYVEGASSGDVVVGGSAPPPDGALAGGAFWLPTLIDGVDPRDPIAQEEVFGPVLVTLPFEDEAQALALANGTAYGLIAALWTRDLSRAHRLAGALEAGQVFVNTFGAGGGVELPFGGVKASGYGREKGIEALAGFTHTKTVVVRLT
nr:aldehyde dehydrogenase family protein [Serinicoccus chungangensis]